MIEKAKILLAEDERNFGMILRDYLQMNGFLVDWAENGQIASEFLKRNKYDLCLFDIMMPKTDGFTLAEETRQLYKDTPFIFLTARGMKEDILKGYRLGADDFITKPFDSEVLLMKINVVLQRKPQENQTSGNYTIASFYFDAQLRTLRSQDGKEQKLSPKESALLQMLCQYQNNVLPREKALKQIWKDDSYFTARSMDVYITKLRKCLSEDSNIEISNVHGNGYCLRVEIR
jgi:DNA-binding response OmpR family regulator